MKKLLLMVFGLSLFMVACTDDDPKVGGESFKINDSSGYGFAFVDNIADNTPVFIKDGIITIGIAGTEVLTGNVDAVQLAGTVGTNIMMMTLGAQEFEYPFPANGISFFNAKVSVADDQRSVTINIEFLTPAGDKGKTFKAIVKTSLHSFLKPTVVDPATINYTYVPLVTEGLTFTGGDATSDNGSIKVVAGKITDGSKKIIITVDKNTDVIYGDVFEAILGAGTSVGEYVSSASLINTNKIEPVNMVDKVVGTSEVSASLIFVYVEIINNTIVFNKIFTDGYMFHLLPFDFQIVKAP